MLTASAVRARSFRTKLSQWATPFNAQYRFVAWYLWNAEDAEPMCNGLMAVELYRHDGDNGRGKKAMDEFEYIDLAANLSLASDMHKLKVSPAGSRARTPTLSNTCTRIW